jgi:hypothetical protein
LKKYWLIILSISLLAVTSYAQVTISSPASGATVSSPIKFVASAVSSTTYPITAMRIYVDSVSMYTVNASSLSTSISLATGSHNVTIVAWDGTGKSYSKAESITVSTTPTTTAGITVSSPGSGATVTSPVSFVASATTGTSTLITAMRLYVDSVSKYTVSSSSLTTSQALTTGTHNVTFVAWDSTGKAYNRSLSIYVSGATPSSGKVTITSPTAGSTVNSPSQFTASATAPTGRTISSMTLYVDGVSKYTSNSASLSTSQTLASGSHTILVKAVDSAGSTYQASEGITVATAPAPAPQHYVTVDWTENATNIAGYNVYRKAAGATSYTKLTSTMTTATAYTDHNVTAGATYTYVVTAISNTGVESGFSQPATATVPTP